MPWTIPDKGEGQNDVQSILFQEALDVLVAGISGVDCVLSGGAVTAQGSPNMTVAVAAVTVLSNSVQRVVAGANGTITTADATNPRLDYVVITSAGAIAVRAGTAAAAPKPPNRTANDVVLAQVYVPAADTTISTDQITDRRVFPDVGRLPLAGGTMAGAITSTAVVNPFTTAAESWIGPSSTTGIYFKGGNFGFGAAPVAGAIIDVSQSGTGSAQSMIRFLKPGMADSDYMTMDFGKDATTNQAGGFFYKYMAGGSVVGLYHNGDAGINGYGVLIKKGGYVGVGGIAAPTAIFNIGPGSASAGTAPLKLTSATLNTTPEAGAIEHLTDDFFATITTGAARKAFVLDNGARLTSGKIPIASTNGRLIDGQTPLAGTKVYYVADTSSGAVTRKLTFVAGVLTAET